MRRYFCSLIHQCQLFPQESLGSYILVEKLFFFYKKTKTKTDPIEVIPIQNFPFPLSKLLTFSWSTLFACPNMSMSHPPFLADRNVWCYFQPIHEVMKTSSMFVCIAWQKKERQPIYWLCLVALLATVSAPLASVCCGKNFSSLDPSQSLINFISTNKLLQL